MSLHKPPAVFRPEIEGLRAIAAILVAVFHIWLGRVSGGVDVFFVVSSFLITTGLLGHIDRWQRVDFALFWGRLIKRLVPVAYLVLCAVVVVGIVMMPKSRWKDTIEQVAASALYLENWALAFRSVPNTRRSAPSNISGPSQSKDSSISCGRCWWPAPLSSHAARKSGSARCWSPRCQ
jgi:peptidoglycan/LPS O-acetylase OafA/YrhL